jgi:micrococcal nuclease
MNRNKTLNKKIILLLVSGVLVLTGYLFKDVLNPRLDSKKEVNGSFSASGNYDYNDILVKRVVDGDTLLLESREYVRLLGIDTPEIHESAKLYRDAQRSKESIKKIKQDGMRAYEFTKQLTDGKRVRLEFDTEKYDKYNRILAYVFLEDGTFVNGRIVEEGYASLTHFKLNVKYTDLLSRLYREARENKRGLWAQD